MGWHTTTNADEFLGTAGDFLRTRPVENTVPLTVAATVRDRGPHHYAAGNPLFGWFTDDSGAVTGAFLQTPPWPLLLTVVPDGSVPALADLLADRPLPGVNALTADAEAFAEQWCARTGAQAAKGRQSRLFRLDRLTPPDPPPGAARVAGPDDRPLLIDWIHAFHRDIGEPSRSVEDLVDDKLSHRGLTLWEVDGTPVAMAGTTRPEAGMVRVLAVYTPRELRRHGYGGAVTAAVTRAALDAGADDVVLFTDLANPTSNALYQRLGYRPVEDRSLVEFTA
jgi:RimJ/RimL family protein N-acetyltransferase